MIFSKKMLDIYYIGPTSKCRVYLDKSILPYFEIYCKIRKKNVKVLGKSNLEPWDVIKKIPRLSLRLFWATLDKINN